jgi:branched-chain amino acid transport system permease protein
MTAAFLDAGPRHGSGTRLAWMLAAGALGIYAIAFASPYELRVLALAGTQVLLVLGYQFVFGHAGALSLAQGAFFGIGAYVTAILGGTYGWGFLATFPLSIAAPLALAALVAAPVLRLASHYFALATLGLAQVVLLAVVNGGGATGGALGIAGIPGVAVLGWTLPRGLPFAAMVWAVVALGAWLSHRLTRGLTGGAYGVLRGDALAAAAIGLDRGRLRFTAFLLSAAYAGAAGALSAHAIGVVSSEALEFPVMVSCLAMTVIGGSTRIAGAFLGALLLVHLPEWLRFLEGYALLAYGAALLAAIIAAPEGIAGLLASRLPRSGSPTNLTPLLPPARAAPGWGETVLEARGLAKRFGGIVALDNVDVTLAPGEILGVIGPNGSGKTTLANLITGFAAMDAGTLRLAGRSLDRADAAAIANAGIARSFQTPALPPDFTALDAVAVARASIGRRIGIAAALAGEDAGEHRARIEAQALGFLARLGAAGAAGTRCGDLAPGLARRVEIARALALEPRLLILDEPAAGLDETEQRELAALLTALAEDGLALIVIEHNMEFLLPVADRVLALDQGRVIASGVPAEIRRDPAVIATYFGRDASAEP